MKFVFNDGGRQKAGFKGATGDCGVRASAIVLNLPYKEVYDLVNTYCSEERVSKKSMSKKSNSRTGVYRKTLHKYLISMGMKWVPTMSIGSGCKVHLKKEELPNGRLLVRLSGHYSSVIDGVIHDTFDPSRDETRCIYGYYVKEIQNV
jgi:hypothetical protein